MSNNPGPSTIKYQNFISGPMKGKLIQDVPGIGDAIGGRFRDDGILYAPQLYGQCLVHQMDQKLCENYIMGFGANSGQASKIYNGMSDWHNQFQ